MVTLGEENQRGHLDILVRNGAFKFSDTFFTYTSGQIGPYFVNSEKVMNNGVDYSRATTDMSHLVRKVMGDKDYVIAGGERRDFLFSLPVAPMLVKPPYTIYKNGEVMGPDTKDRLVITISDLNNEGSSIEKWVQTIRKNGGRIEDAFFYVDRLEDGGEVIQELGLNSHCLVPLDENAWKYLREKGEASEQAYSNLKERMKDKDAWAKRMLRGEEGIERLASLFKVESLKEREKARKVLTQGYPYLMSELMRRLKEKGFDFYSQKRIYSEVNEAIDSMEKDQKWFKTNTKYLAAQYPRSRYVAIQSGKVADHDQNEDQLVARANKTLKRFYLLGDLSD